MAPEFYYTYDNVKFRNLTNYQRALLFHIVGMLSFESVAPKSVFITVSQGLRDGHIIIVIRKIRRELVQEYMKTFSFPDSEHVKINEFEKGNCIISVPCIEMNFETTTIQQFELIIK